MEGIYVRGPCAYFGGMESSLDFHSARALLEWQIELGATEAIGDVPVNRFEIPDALPKAKRHAAQSDDEAVPELPPVAQVDAVTVSQRLADATTDLADLRRAISGFDLCELKRGARNLVFADGNPAARVMIVGEAPGREEDKEGRPFVGPAGQLLDKMFDAIDMARDGTDQDGSIYITNVLPWRPPQNRDPEGAEIAMMLPFLKKHVALVQPDVLVLMGNVSCQAVLAKKGITRLRGKWTTGFDLPVLPMFHPAYLLRNPAAKREAWNDLLSLRARLKS